MNGIDNVIKHFYIKREKESIFFRFLKTSKSILDIFKMSIFEKRRLENRKKCIFHF